MSNFGPDTVCLVRAECTPNDRDGIDPTVEGGPIELSDAC